MSDQKSLTVTNYDKVKALAKNTQVIQSFASITGSKTSAVAYISSALLAVASNNALMECEPASIMSTALRAASLHLSCDPSLGQAYPVPFKGKATLQLGYRGIEQLALRTGKYRFINTSYISEGQSIEIDELTGQARIHGAKSVGGKVIGYFNYFELFNGFSHALYMTVEEIQEHGNKYSQNFSNPTSKWKTEFHKMAMKTVLRLNLLRYGVIEQRELVQGEMHQENTGDEPIVFETTFEDVIIEVEPPAPARTTNEVMSDLGFDTPADEEWQSVGAQQNDPDPDIDYQRPPAKPAAKQPVPAQPAKLSNGNGKTPSTPAEWLIENGLADNDFSANGMIKLFGKTVTSENKDAFKQWARLYRAHRDLGAKSEEAAAKAHNGKVVK